MKILTIFGTRPEAIKMMPVILESANHPGIENIVCCTGQHKKMVRQVLKLFDITPHHNLDIMIENQQLFYLTRALLTALEKVMLKEKPDLVLVQGDTTTTFVGALAAFYMKINIGHLEAGLRTYNKYAPYPEEINRKFTSHLADYHFAPSLDAKNNLLKENVPPDKIFVTGNTGIDALMYVHKRVKNLALDQIETVFPSFKSPFPRILCEILQDEDKKKILVTGHRRENFGKNIENICLALKKLSTRKDIEIIYPVHLNPNIRKPVASLLEGISNIHLLEHLDYVSFVFLMTKSYLILTDSGGIQEEAPCLGKPVLVMRKITERPEAVKSGSVKIVGTDMNKIKKSVEDLLDSRSLYLQMARVSHPYGDGQAAARILEIIKNEFKS